MEAGRKASFRAMKSVLACTAKASIQFKSRLVLDFGDRGNSSGKWTYAGVSLLDFA